MEEVPLFVPHSSNAADDVGLMILVAGVCI